MSLTVTQVIHPTPAAFITPLIENTISPPLSTNKRVHTDGPGAHPSACSEGKRRQLSFSDDRSAASKDVKTTYQHMTTSNSSRSRSFPESDASIEPDDSGVRVSQVSGDKRKGRLSEGEAEEALEPESINNTNGSGSSDSEDHPHSLDLLVKSFRPRNNLIPHRAATARVPSVRTPPQELWNITTVLQPKDWNTTDTSSPSSLSSLSPSPTTPSTPPGLTKRPLNPPLSQSRESNLPNIATSSRSNTSISSSSNSDITDNGPPTEGTSSNSVTNTVNGDNTTDSNNIKADNLSPSAFELPSFTPGPELVSWPPPSPSLMASDFGLSSIPQVQPYPDWNVPPSPVLSHRHLPIDASPMLAAPQPRHLDDLCQPYDSFSHYSGHFNPFAEWSNEWLVRSRKTYVDYIAKKREKNPHAPIMPSFANPIRATAPSRAWLHLPEGKYVGSRPSPRRYKHALTDFEMKQRSRYSCDQYSEPRAPQFFLESRRHCRHCNLDSMCKKLLALRFNQHQLYLDDEEDDAFPSLPSLTDDDASSESEASEFDGVEEGSPFDDFEPIINAECNLEEGITPDSPMIRDMDSFEEVEVNEKGLGARGHGHGQVDGLGHSQWAEDNAISLV